MPSIANITVKKFDGATDIVYAVQTASSGDGSWAKWRQDAGNTAPYAGRPTLAIRVSESKNNIRRIEVQYSYPYVYTDTSTGQVVISPLNVNFRNGQWTAPQGVPSNVLQEAGAQFANLMASSQVKTCFVDQTAFV